MHNQYIYILLLLPEVLRGSTLSNYTLQGTYCDIIHGICRWMKRNETVLFDCTVGKNEGLHFYDIRDCVETVNDFEIQVSILCNGGILLLRNPIKAKNLTKLFIQSCSIRQLYYYDFDNFVIKMPYTLRDMEMVDCQINSTTYELTQMMFFDAAKISRHYPCTIAPSLKRFIQRNVTHTIHITGGKGYSELKARKPDFDAELPLCFYRNLIYYEVSFFQRDFQDGFQGIDVHHFLEKSPRFPKLTVLNFTHGYLKRMPCKLYNSHWTNTFPTLKTVDVSFNEIVEIPSWSLGPGKKRKFYVNLSHNKVRNLNQREVKCIKTMYPSIIDLKDNPFECNCDLRAMLDFINDDVENVPKEYLYLKNLKCHLPLLYSGKKMGQMKTNELCDKVSFDVCPYISFGFCVIFLVSFSGFLRFRKEIKILSFTRLGGILSMNRANWSHSKDFDAFVSYSSIDESWVFAMCKRLEEGPQHLKLCLHHKHFIPGACISDNIIDSVERSRHTIMILSKNFLQSEWCILEFRKAFHQTLIERKRHLIVIMLEDVQYDDIEPDLKFFLQMHTYLKVSEFLFWDKLIYSLSEKKSHNKFPVANSIETLKQLSE